VVVAENKEHPAPEIRDRVELSESFERSKGVQVIQTAGLADGYVPPSASLAPPPAVSTPPAASQTPPPGNATSGSGSVSGNGGQP
jgi:hypothetical protein